MSPNADQPAAPPPVSATVHIYRGLMDRAATWRIRIDAPTNWAVITGGTSVSFVLSNPQHSHAVLLLIMVFTLGFLFIEARRIRYYDLWSNWVRVLETEFFAPILRDNRVAINEIWQQIIISDMADPHFKTEFRQLLGRRLRDNYLAIYLFLVLSWLLKLSLHPRPDLPAMAPDTFAAQAAVGPLAGWLVLSAVLGFYVGLLVLTLVTYYSPEPSIEVLGRERMMQKLASPDQQPISRRPWSHDAHARAPGVPHGSDPLD